MSTIDRIEYEIYSDEASSFSVYNNVSPMNSDELLQMFHKYASLDSDIVNGPYQYVFATVRLLATIKAAGLVVLRDADGRIL